MNHTQAEKSDETGRGAAFGGGATGREACLGYFCSSNLIPDQVPPPPLRGGCIRNLSEVDQTG